MKQGSELTAVAQLKMGGSQYVCCLVKYGCSVLMCYCFNNISLYHMPHSKKYIYIYIFIPRYGCIAQARYQSTPPPLPHG